MIEETEKSRKTKKAQIGLDRPKPMTDLDDLDHYLVHVAELEAEIERLQGHMRALADTSVARDTAGIFKGLWQGSEQECEKLRAENERLRSLLGKLHWKSIDKDNMEFRCDTTCYVMDEIRAALAPKP